MKLSRRKELSSMRPAEIRSGIDKVLTMLDELWSDKNKKKSFSYLVERESVLENRLLELEEYYPKSLEYFLDKTFVRNMDYDLTFNY